ncbi:MAG: hypothetical protein ACFFBD_11330 [Candidatus Hodarchaeota archaeon]
MQISFDAPYPWLNASLGLIVFIKAVFLIVGVNFISKSGEAKEWSTNTHNLILIADIATGSGLVILSFFQKMYLSFSVYLVLSIIFVFHMYREIKFF